MFVAHLDADCFYVSAERVRNAGLAGVPVGVLGNNGACVIAKSYEMKACGVKTGEPVWDAAAKCPDGVFVKRDFKWYEVLSRLMLDAVRRFSAQVEYYSIDEFFFRVDAPAREAEKVARRARDEVMSEVKVPATVGVGRTRTLAKLISDRAKPFGALALLDRPAEEEYLARLPVTEVSGIGGGRARRLATYGLSTCLDLCNADAALVRKLLTVVGERLRDELRGVPREAIRAERPAHVTLSRGGSVGVPTADRGIVWAWAVRNLERLVEELEFYRVRPARLTLWMSYADDASRVAELDLDAPTDRFDLLVDALAVPDARVLARRLRAVRQDEPHRGETAGRRRPCPGHVLGRLARPVATDRRVEARGQRPRPAVGRPQRGDAAAGRVVRRPRPLLRDLRRARQALLLTARCPVLHGVSLLTGDIPLRLFDAHGLAGREYRRGPAAEPEARFLAFERPRLLPVWSCGRLLVVAWGSDDKKSGLPTALWVRLDSASRAGRGSPGNPSRSSSPASAAWIAGGGSRCGRGCAPCWCWTPRRGRTCTPWCTPRRTTTRS